MITHFKQFYFATESQNKRSIFETGLAVPGDIVRHPEPGIIIVKKETGETRWYKDDQKSFPQLHRDGGPAVYWRDSNTTYWYRNGLLHRLDGPAYNIDDAYGQPVRRDHYINGKYYTPEEFERAASKYPKEDRQKAFDALDV